VVICLERGADLHMAQLMPLPLTVSCFSKIQIGFTFLVPAHLRSPGKGPLNGCVCDGHCVLAAASVLYVILLICEFSVTNLASWLHKTTKVLLIYLLTGIFYCRMVSMR